LSKDNGKFAKFGVTRIVHYERESGLHGTKNSRRNIKAHGGFGAHAAKAT